MADDYVAQRTDAKAWQRFAPAAAPPAEKDAAENAPHP
jgi:hypothetical protein